MGYEYVESSSSCIGVTFGEFPPIYFKMLTKYINNHLKLYGSILESPVILPLDESGEIIETCGELAIVVKLPPLTAVLIVNVDVVLTAGVVRLLTVVAPKAVKA